MQPFGYNTFGRAIWVNERHCVLITVSCTPAATDDYFHDGLLIIWSLNGQKGVTQSPKETLKYIHT